MSHVFNLGSDFKKIDHEQLISVLIRDAPDTALIRPNIRPAGYTANMNVGYRISGRIFEWLNMQTSSEKRNKK
jgi:hypothetical protein